MANPSRRPRGAVRPKAPEEPRSLDPTEFRWSIVPHTHWDREWYMPFDHFRIRLARTVDEIVETLEGDPAFRRFTLDGQAIILDDYADLRPPERVERLHALAAAGRIAVGPAYVLPDEFLVGAESLVRNFLMGRETCRRHGLEPMPVGYMPDTFGHVAQLPQILRGFGLDTFVFWRGLDDRADALGTVFAWRAPDGSAVAAIRQLGGYGNACQIGAWGAGGADFRDRPEAWPAVAAQRFSRYLDLYGDAVRRGPLDHLLLCNGSDHEPIWAPLAGLLDAARAAHPGLEVSVDSYADFVDAVRPQLTDLPVVDGELVGGREAPVLRGINSARMYLKQSNERTERALSVAETLASLAVLKGTYAYPLHELRVAWRELLKNQPHDSISGCSVDDTHRDMQQRYVTAGAMAERVRREALAALADRVERWSYRPTVGASATVVNPLPQPRARLVNVPIPPDLLDEPELALGTRDGLMAAQREGDVLRASVWMPPWAAEPVSVERGSGRSVGAARATGERTIENEFYRVGINPDGWLTVTDRRSGKTWSGLHRFEDVGDRGDEYNFDALPGEAARSAGFAEVRVRSSGPHVAELEARLTVDLPARLEADRSARSADRVACEISSVIRLVAGVDRVEVVTTVENLAEDHRLRVIFPAPEASEPVRAEGHFDVVRRRARPAWSGSGWVEPPASTGHTAGAVSVGELVVLTKGLPEYEAIQTANGLEVAITLLRCVGWLSRDDLVSRPGHAGPELPTPGAQCPGRHTFEYAFRFGELDDTALVATSADYRTDFEVGPEGVEPDGVLVIGGDPVAFATMKGAEDGDGVVLRLFNPSAAAADVLISRPATRIRMDEAQPAAGGPRLEPGEIATYRLR
ncbi:MAG TPA: glycoside hydrolase family 38 C-terminal domain-containing protein [Candidatus Limnocylindria bacterium]|nr:glycoside hydrolase family 38 C-terminal domain-containing protein [Candidatus Limnocylindria bacterium]